MRLSFLLCLAFLVSCQTTGTPRTVFIAPEIKQYSPEEQNRAADELEKCECEMLDRMIGDYGQLREAIRSVNSSKPKGA